MFNLVVVTLVLICALEMLTQRNSFFFSPLTCSDVKFLKKTNITSSMNLLVPNVAVATVY